MTRLDRVVRTIASAAGLVLVALALAGCELEGRVDIGADAVADVDITFVRELDSVGSEDESCGTWIVGFRELTFERKPIGTPDQVRCHVFGRQSIADPPTWAFNVIDGRYVVALPGWGDGNAQDDRLQKVDLAVTFPGPIQAASGNVSVSGRTVRLTDARAINERGVLIVAANGGLPWAPPAFLWLPVGLAAGAGATFLAMRRRGAPSTPGAAEEAGEEDPPRQEPPADPGVWARSDPPG